MEKSVLYYDNQSALNLAKNPMCHEKTEHINVKLNFICDITETDMFSILKIDTKVNPVYMLTKSLPMKKFKLCLDLVDV